MKTSTGQMSNMVVANYELGGGATKRVSLNIQSVKAAPVQATNEVAIAEVAVTATVVPNNRLTHKHKKHNCCPTSDKINLLLLSKNNSCNNSQCNINEDRRNLRLFMFNSRRRSNNRNHHHKRTMRFHTVQHAMILSGMMMMRRRQKKPLNGFASLQ